MAASSASPISRTQQDGSVLRSVATSRQPGASSSFAEALDAMERQLGEPGRANRAARSQAAKPSGIAAGAAIEQAVPQGEPPRPAEPQTSGAADAKSTATERPVAPSETADPAGKVDADGEVPEALLIDAQPQPPVPPPAVAPQAAVPATVVEGDAAAAPAEGIDASAAVAVPAEGEGKAGIETVPSLAAAAASKGGGRTPASPASAEPAPEAAQGTKGMSADAQATAPRPAQEKAASAAARAPEATGPEPAPVKPAETPAPATAGTAAPDTAPQPAAAPSAGPSAFGTEVAQKTAAQAPAPGSPVPIHALAITIAARAGAGTTRFDIRLDPAELGRIDVQLTVDRDGAVKSRLVVEKQETLDLLQRDQRNLERALAQAGVQTNEGSLEFSLKDQGGESPRDRQPEEQASRHQVVVEDPDAAAALKASAATYARAAAMRGGVDIRI